MRKVMKMRFNNRGGASFFKILLRESIDRFPLPPAFAKKHLETSNVKKQTVVLKIKAGVKWSVTYIKMKDTHYFVNGWLKFMKDNRVQMGDFLVFWLLSTSPNPIFDVFIYGPNACLRHPTNSDDAGPSNGKTPIPLVKEEASDEETNDDDLLENVHHKMTRVMRKSHYTRMPMKNSFVKATGINRYESVQLRNDEGKTWTVKLATTVYASYPTTQMTIGWYYFRIHNKIKIGNTCEFYHLNSNLLHVRVLTAEEGK